jgi:hypothetical protein
MDYVIIFDIYPKSITNGWRNILRFTALDYSRTANYWNQIYQHSMLPKVDLYPTTSRIYLYSTFSPTFTSPSTGTSGTQYNINSNSNLKLFSWSRITITVSGSTMSLNTYDYYSTTSTTWSVGIPSIYNRLAYDDIDIYGSTPSQTAVQGVIQNLLVCTSATSCNIGNTIFKCKAGYNN